VGTWDGAAGGLDGDTPGETGVPPSFDITTAHPARVYDYWLGGKDNFEADREAAERAVEAYPDILRGVRANRAFLRRAVHYLAGEQGIRQFLDLGTGLPTSDNTHQIAQEIAPESRIVYVDNDPIVLAHARALLTSSREGATYYIDADIRDTARILREAAQMLDFSKPIAVMALLVLQYIPDSDNPRQVVADIMNAVPSGSYLIVTDTTRDIHPDQGAAVTQRLNARMGSAQLTMRTREEIADYFDGLDLVEPGLVSPAHWRPVVEPVGLLNAYAGMGRKRR
jgi:hypothetical protein